MSTNRWRWRAVLVAAFALVFGTVGCHHARRAPIPAAAELPTEAAKVTHPTYTIEAPDILVINAANLVPRPPYLVSALDVLGIQVTQGVKKEPLVDNEPIAGLFSVGPDNLVDLGYSYGSVSVVGLNLEQARDRIEKHLLARFNPPLQVSVSLAQSNQSIQQIRGDHLVRIDGTIGLGIYGSVYVDGMDLKQAKTEIEKHLSKFMVDPKVSVDVAGFNSKVYYIITDGAGAGQQVYRLPLTGKETVLDAIVGSPGTELEFAL